MELIARKWKELDILPVKYNHATIHSNGKLVQHKKKDTHLTVAELLMILYVDDGAIMFCNREDLEVGSKVVTEQMARLGLIVHRGTSEKKYKTKIMFSPQAQNVLNGSHLRIKS